jgi:AcrR family transcriptional regulator
MNATPNTPPRRSANETRDHLLQVASELFYWQGIRATGVDTIAAQAGVGPTTLYRLFASKDDLVAAYVQRASHGYQAWFTHATRPAIGEAPERILALFDALQEQIQPENCRGCPFLMALAEIPDPAHPAHAHAVATKTWVREQFLALATELTALTPAIDPATLADQLTLVFEGVYASVQALGAAGPARRARDLAAALTDSPAPPR